MNKISVKLLIT